MVSDFPRKVKVGALVVGNEILLGRTRDTNTVFLAEQLFKRGLKLTRWVIVPDIDEEISLELNRFLHDGFDIVVICGGMGPTHDDITVEAVARALKVPMEYNEECYSRMFRKWRGWNPGKELPESGKTGLKKMAMMPRDFDLINNQEGMVEGLVGSVKRGNGLVFILPGVPREYKGIVGTHKFQDYLPPGHDSSVDIIEVRFRGRESELASYLLELQNKYRDVDVGSYPQGPRNVIIRLTGDPYRIKEAQLEVKEITKKLELEGIE